MECTDEEGRKAAWKTLQKKRQKLVADRRTARLLEQSLSRPRDSKNRSRKHVVHPLKCGENGDLSLSPALWEKEFRKRFSELFDDPLNSAEVQDSRLDALRRDALNCPLSSSIEITVEDLREVLSRAHRKQNSASGGDGVTWQALSCLGDKAVRLLCALFNKRLHGYDLEDTLNDWIKVIAVMLPKKDQPRSVNEWRPMCLTSCLQKCFLSCVCRLLEQWSAPVDFSQYGFVEGKQTMEVSEAARNALVKSVTFPDAGSLVILKCDVSRAFDNMSHHHISTSLLDAGCPKLIVAALMRELAHAKLEVHFQGQVWSDFTYSRGGKQGGGGNTSALGSLA